MPFTIGKCPSIIRRVDEICLLQQIRRKNSSRSNIGILKIYITFIYTTDFNIITSYFLETKITTQNSR